VADAPRFPADVAVQYFCRLVNTFGSFTGARHATGDSRVEMIAFQTPVITTVFVYYERQEMKKRLIAGLLAAAVLGAASTIPAEASCRGAGHCSTASVTKKHHSKLASARIGKKTMKLASARHGHRTVKLASAQHGQRTVKVSSIPARKRVHMAFGSGKVIGLRHHRQRTMEALAIPVASSASQGNVISLIKAMAPSQGVPTWFALRIAHVESNYNPNMRGSAGEYGVFQMKCATAKDIGFGGNCGALLDPRTNIQWGLKHLALAIGRSDGNLRLAASKHNGGLGRRTLVPTYVARVF